MKIVSFANPISCQLNPTLRNILKFTQSAGGGMEGKMDREKRGGKKKRKEGRKRAG